MMHCTAGLQPLTFSHVWSAEAKPARILRHQVGYRSLAIIPPEWLPTAQPFYGTLIYGTLSLGVASAGLTFLSS